jgi:hypothetical protein
MHLGRQAVYLGSHRYGEDVPVSSSSSITAIVPVPRCWSAFSLTVKNLAARGLD